MQRRSTSAPRRQTNVFNNEYAEIENVPPETNRYANNLSQTAGESSSNGSKNDRKLLFLLKDSVSKLKCQVEFLRKKDEVRESALQRPVPAQLQSIDIDAMKDLVLRSVQNEFSLVIKEIVKSCANEQASFLSTWSEKEKQLRERFYEQKSQHLGSGPDLEKEVIRLTSELSRSKLRIDSLESGFRELKQLSFDREEHLHQFSRKTVESCATELEVVVENVAKGINETLRNLQENVELQQSELKTLQEAQEKTTRACQNGIRFVTRSTDKLAKELKEALAEQSEAVRLSTEGLQDSKLGIAELRFQVNTNRKEGSALKGQLEVLCSSCESLIQTQAQIQNTLEKLDNRVETIAETLSQCHDACESQKESNKKWKSKLRDLASSVANVRKYSDDVLAKLEEHQSQALQENSQFQQMGARLEALERGLLSVRSEMLQARSESSEHESCVRLRETEELAASVHRFEKSVAAIELEISEMKENQSVQSEELFVLEEKLTTLDAEFREQKKETSENLNRQHKETNRLYMEISERHVQSESNFRAELSRLENHCKESGRQELRTCSSNLTTMMDERFAQTRISFKESTSQLGSQLRDEMAVLSSEVRSIGSDLSSQIKQEVDANSSRAAEVEKNISELETQVAQMSENYSSLYEQCADASDRLLQAERLLRVLEGERTFGISASTRLQRLQSSPTTNAVPSSSIGTISCHPSILPISSNSERKIFPLTSLGLSPPREFPILITPKTSETSISVPLHFTKSPIDIGQQQNLFQANSHRQVNIGQDDDNSFDNASDRLLSPQTLGTSSSSNFSQHSSQSREISRTSSSGREHTRGSSIDDKEEVGLQTPSASDNDDNGSYSQEGLERHLLEATENRWVDQSNDEDKHIAAEIGVSRALFSSSSEELRESLLSERNSRREQLRSKN